MFDKIYVLTIDRNNDRHPQVESILKDINFEYWYGFDARKNFPDKKFVCYIENDFFFENDIDKEYVSRMTVGQLGAYFSIKKMIDHIASCAYDKVLIFEDDMLPLRKDWKQVLQKAVAELPGDWDVLLAGYIYDGNLYKYARDRNMRPFIKGYNYLKNIFKPGNVIDKLPIKYSKHLDFAGYCTGGHAYCISKKGAKIISANLSPMRDSGDVLISRLITKNKIKAFSVYPCLFLQDRKFASKTEII